MITGIEWYAKTIMGIKLFPAQVEFIKALVDGKLMVNGRKQGITTASKVVREYLKDGLKPMVERPELVLRTIENVANDPAPHIWQPQIGRGELFNRAAVAQEVLAALERDKRLRNESTT